MPCGIHSEEAQIVEGLIMSGHVYMCLSIPPKYAVSNLMEYIKGKSAIVIARHFGGRIKNLTGKVFWARGYFASTMA